MKQNAPTKTHLCSELVSICWEEETRGVRSATANLEAIAETEASVLSDIEIPLGKRLWIDCQGHRLQGVVRTSTFDPVLGYFIGVELDPESRWSEKWFTPAHLLKLWRSVEEPEGHLRPSNAA
jgi:hypothetical protein